MIENRHTRRELSRTRARAARTHTPGFWALALIGFLALGLQTFIVQTHIHIPQGAGRPQTLSLVTLGSSSIEGKSAERTTGPRDRFPINEDPANCPLCQEIAHSGQYVASTAALASVPVTATIRFIVFDVALPAFDAVSHSWRGRAPPQA